MLLNEKKSLFEQGTCITHKKDAERQPINLSVSAYFGLYTIKYIKKLLIAIEGSRSEFAGS